MPDLDKLYEKADKYLQRKKFDSAIETYREILRYEPDDEVSLVNLGDLSLKLNRTADGLRYQRQLAEHYIKRNETAKAIVTYRKLLKLSPQDVTVLARLAELLERAQKTAEALEVHCEALACYRKARLNEQMLACLLRIVKLDPGKIEEHLELAELAGGARQTNVAMAALLRAVELARPAGDESLWEKLVDRAHALDPADEKAAVLAAELYLKRGNAAQATKLVEPLLAARPDDLHVLELACQGLLEIGDYPRAQPLCLRLYQANPRRVDFVLKLLRGLVRTGHVPQVLETASNLKVRLFQEGKRDDFLKIMEKVYESDESNLEILETLSGLYNEMNKEDGLRRSLSRLFNLYLAGENYCRAGETLERMLDVDPYAAGHYDRLLNLEGHLDPVWYQSILARTRPPSTAPVSPARTAKESETEESLDDLVVEAEMYSQYQLSSKLKQTLERIDRLFPGAGEQNQKLRDLCETAGYTPKFKAPATLAKGSQRSAGSPESAPLQSLEDVRKISEITADIYRESTLQGVLHVAVTGIGRALNASRCWGAAGAPDRGPVLTAECCLPPVSPSHPDAALKLFAFLMSEAAFNAEGWSIENVSQAPSLAAVSAQLHLLGIRSLLARPLIDKDAPVGLLLLEQCDAARTWSPAEALLLQAICTQVAVAVNNTRLRRLEHSLAGTDPETGLLPRSAYLECLLSEARRAKDQSQPLSVCLLEPDKPRALIRALGDADVHRFMLELSKVLTPTVRQSDISIRYGPLTIAVVFPDSGLSQAGEAAEKVRRALSQVRAKGLKPTEFCAAVCDVPLEPGFDAVDGVTEAINRLETSLDRAHREGAKAALISRFFA